MRDGFDGLPIAEIALSAGGMFLVLTTLMNEPTSVLPQKPIHLIIFITICLLGGVATLFPRRCSLDIPVSGDLQPARYTKFLGTRIIHGHHSDCIGFSNHEIRLSEKRICAGCLGLLTGSILAILITTTQIIQNILIPPQSGYLGLLFVAAGLAYSVLVPGSPPALRTSLNALLVTGFALVYLSLTSTRGLGLLGISFGLFWMFTRIRLSRWSHERLCAGCNESCEEKKSES
jgi:hypothetical protein